MSGPVDCDVIIPFRDHLPYLEQSLESILNQRGVRCAIHLVDDVSSVDTTTFRQRWRQVPNLLWYRNDRNVGPYRSVHRVFPHLQSDFIAIQDADDIAEPDRMALSVASLVDNRADLFAAAAVTFGDSSDDCGPTLYSRMPLREDWFVLHATLVVRRALFQRLNGFADFFCGGDTEFGVRAYFARARFQISQRVVLRHREHSESLTRNRHTGWHRETDPPTWISPYRRAVWSEIRRRRRLFLQGVTDFASFGCLDPACSRTLGCVGEPYEFAGAPAVSE